jgi:hypothetical protein
MSMNDGTLGRATDYPGADREALLFTALTAKRIDCTAFERGPRLIMVNAGIG